MFFKLKIIYHWLRLKLRQEFSSRAELEAYQAKKLAEFAQRILVKSPFYRPYAQRKPLDWSAFPQLSKAEFMANFDSINTCGIKLEQAMPFALEAEKSRAFKNDIEGITVGLSTGTSGKRGLFLVSEDERALWVALVMNRVIKPRLFKKQKIAFFLRANSNLYASVSSSLFEFKYFDIFKPLPSLLEELHAFAPDILAAQPSLLIDLAKAQAKQAIAIRPIQLISFAEVLHARDKAFIAEVFQAPISEVYQCTEGFLGATCAEGTMHLNEDFIKFDREWIDEDKFYPIISDFSRQSQPIIRYKLNDVLQVRKEPCPCGSPRLALAQIMGRDDDVLLLGGQKVYPDLLVRRLAISSDDFQNYQLIQVGDKQLELHIEAEAELYPRIMQDFQQAILGLFQDLGIEGVQLEFKAQTVRVPGQKLRKIIRQI